MVLRPILAAIGLLELLWPRRTVDFWMGLAAECGRDVELRPWVYTAARVEGLSILLWVLTRGRGE